MTEPSPSGAPHHHAHVVVHHVVDANPPFRRVDILGTEVGRAHSLRDVAEFCRRAGLDELDLEADDMVQWIGGGSDVWE
ncbi:hypothetical protein DN069_02575 [Streptacidiphilus pinicola]|uniref:Uncharacterized protein n=1 Tax=Streptacidiphilus pinicola TaxID=2219663 RepID=A0A2X0JAG7_9ACTN|nr:hypothetical protein [Streptacidiphilus pinicola]RAG87226.1 hypothetical protein DN069_02575 [Streptacidiphilus pinicola]